jgi:hypothetical protein
MTTASTITTNEAEIRQLIADRQRAICTKDVDRIIHKNKKCLLGKAFRD